MDHSAQSGSVNAGGGTFPYLNFFQQAEVDILNRRFSHPGGEWNIIQVSTYFGRAERRAIADTANGDPIGIQCPAVHEQSRYPG
jgi:hypothetical protein